MRFTIVLFFFYLLFIDSYSITRAQDLSNPENVKVDDLSDEQLRAYMQQAGGAGLSEDEAVRMARQRGMSPAEIAKLRSRIQQMQAEGETGAPSSANERKVMGGGDSIAPVEKSAAQLRDDSLRSRIYGADLFANAQPVFEPNLRMATPEDYIVGTDDELNIDIYGNSEASYSLKVSPEGNINLPYVGVVNVGGLTIEQAGVRIKQKLSTVYTALNSGATRVSISLNNIRSIKVILTGEVTQPGTYTLPSVATVFNALYSAGGPNAKGTLRHIRVIRNGKQVAQLDLYDFLQNGQTKANIGLRDQDIIQVDPYLERVEMIGEVKRPMLFEMKEGEHFSDLLRYAGGFTEHAYDGRISVIRNNGKEHRMEDLLKSQFMQFEPRGGDIFTVQAILGRFANRVMINGAVFRPGAYELSPGLTLSMLIKKADGLQEDAFRKRGYITRLQDDFQQEQLSFSVADVVAGIAEDIVLKREDVVVIPSIFDLREEYRVNIDGEVRNGGTFDYAAGMTLEQLILMAGGFREGASAHRIEVSRRIKGDDYNSQSAAMAEVFLVDLDRTLKDATGGFELHPFDMVVVRSHAGYHSQKTVKIEGEVLYPGIYTISSKDERISDIVKRAGGFTPYAFLDGASLLRKPIVDVSGSLPTTRTDEATEALSQQQEAERRERVQALQGSIEHTQQNTAALNYSINNYHVGIHLEEIMEDPGYRGDLLVEHGDMITVPKLIQTVKISGEVLAPSTAVYSPNKGFKQYVSQAGGFSPRALKKRAYVVYANGSAQGTGKFLFFNNYPKIKPGAEIFVPQKPERERLSTAAWVGITSSIVATMALVFNVIN